MARTLLIIRNEEGSLIVGAIMVLLLLTIIGISASNTSITEVQMSTNSLLYERTFYTAESGLEHIIELLKVPFIAQNTVALASGTLPNWNFALAGATGADYDHGVEWINTDLDGVTYTVRVWNDDDDGNPTTSPTNDTNGKIFVRISYIHLNRG